jgi:hypothetical protein
LLPFLWGATLSLATETSTAAPKTIPASLNPKILSFNEWKQSKVLSAERALQIARTHLAAVKARAKTSVTSELVDSLRKETQAQWDAEIAKDLTVNDYVALYLGRHSDASSLEAAAAQMSPQETVELLKAFVKNLNNSQFPEQNSDISRRSSLAQ